MVLENGQTPCRWISPRVSCSMEAEPSAGVPSFGSGVTVGRRFAWEALWPTT
jgi:hypothetical protein